MGKVYEIDGIVPVIDPTAFVHPDAVIIGDVIIGPRCYIGPCASLRGDLGRITVGTGSNVQDGCVIHSFPRADVILEEDCHIGHGAVLHGCVIRKNALIGMGAVVMDRAEIGENCFVAAMAFVKGGTVAVANSLLVGVPAAVSRTLTAEEIKWKEDGTLLYQRLAARSLATLKEAKPLAVVEPDRKRTNWFEEDSVPLRMLRKRGR